MLVAGDGGVDFILADVNGGDLLAVLPEEVGHLAGDILSLDLLGQGLAQIRAGVGLAELVGRELGGKAVFLALDSDLNGRRNRLVRSGGQGNGVVALGQRLRSDGVSSKVVVGAAVVIGRLHHNAGGIKFVAVHIARLARLCGDLDGCERLVRNRKGAGRGKGAAGLGEAAQLQCLVGGNSRVGSKLTAVFAHLNGQRVGLAGLELAVLQRGRPGGLDLEALSHSQINHRSSVALKLGVDRTGDGDLSSRNGNRRAQRAAGRARNISITGKVSNLEVTVIVRCEHKIGSADRALFYLEIIDNLAACANSMQIIRIRLRIASAGEGECGHFFAVHRLRRCRIRRLRGEFADAFRDRQPNQLTAFFNRSFCAVRLDLACVINKVQRNSAEVILICTLHFQSNNDSSLIINICRRERKRRSVCPFGRDRRRYCQADYHSKAED